MEYPKEIRVCLHDYSEVTIIVQDKGEYNELVDELNGTLPYVKEFLTQDGRSVDSWFIANIIDES